MRTSSRAPERSRGILALPLLILGSAGLAHCSSESDVVLGREDELGEAGVPHDADVADAPGDAGPPKAPRQDAATSDAGARPVVCASDRCATSIATTNGARPLTAGFCALLHDRTVACWGQNADGELGRGPTGPVPGSATPERVEGLTDIVFLEHNCAIDTAGSTWCWGMGPYLRSTTAALTKQTTPVKIDIPRATMISVSRYLTSHGVACAVTDGKVVCWGMNQYAQVAVPELGEKPTAPRTPEPQPLPDGAPIQKIAVGYAAFVQRTDGTLLSWGASPPLGRLSSLFPDPYPQEVELTGVSAIDVGHDNACAVANGIAYCWGSISGWPGTELSRALPEVVPTPEPVVDIATHSSVGNVSIPQRACAVGVSGDVYCWGNNAHGQVGDGTREWALEPVKVSGLPGPASTVRASARTTCALLVDGRVFCWGDNVTGQLGNGAIKEPSLVPQEVLLP